uniref:Secreted protein n=1 Tax=Oncorhynchus tshawytscha TaxID=74940 RepID=A0AAZ3Q6R3_ONCTS
MANATLHWEHLWGRMPLWTGLTPVCTIWCSAMRLATAKAFPQTEQQKGRSPRWVRSWRSRDSGLLKVLPHCVHGNGLLLVCMLRSCFRRSEERTKSLPQVSHTYGFSPVLSQKGQWYGLSPTEPRWVWA